MSRWLAYGVGLTLAGGTLLPALVPPDTDGYPFSKYPMFTAVRDDVTIHQVVGVRGAERLVLPPTIVVGTPEVMQAAVSVRRSVEAGTARMDALCRSVSARAAGERAFDGLERIEVVAAHFDPVAYLAGDRAPRSRQVLATCVVERHP